MMKTKLLVLFSFIGISALAQSPIVSFTPNLGSNFDLYTTDDPLNQAPQGANVSWSFTGLTPIGSANYFTPAPTPTELTTYPTTTGKLRHVEMYDVSVVTDIFYKSIANDVSITGVSSDGFLINYNTNNAHIGTYPLEYGYNNTDPVSGNYVYDTYAGTFSGNITTTVDAYGTLASNVNPDPVAVTRMKTTQTLSMNYGIFTNVGTFNQTIWDYYTTGSNDPAARVTTTAISIPLLSVNENSTVVELLFQPLKTQSWQAEMVQVAPNPVADLLNIYANGQKIQSVQLSDMTGKIVLDSTAETIDMSALQKGVYFATITTNSGSSVKKVIKK